MADELKGIMIGGVDVKFPFKPYPSQLSMMSMIIKGLEQKKNCLLESPTGSGKTLALLCAALAWQEKQMKIKSYMEMEEDGAGDGKKTKFYVPKIWFGSRTHKQIAQVVSELNTTAYKSVNMTILSSRQHSCIHPVNTNSKSSLSRNEGCLQLIKGTHPDDIGTRCMYKTEGGGGGKMSHSHLARKGLQGTWDLEDLLKTGKRHRFCPYFSSKDLAPSASIIFCPYNYLTDPIIRSSMNICLKNQVVILDEAHNIEDNSRSAASFTLNDDELATTIDDLDKMINREFRIDAMQAMYFLCSKIGTWLHEKRDELVETEFETRSKVWCGQAFIAVLNDWGVNEETLPRLLNWFKEAIETDEEDEKNDFGEEEGKEASPSLKQASKITLEGLFAVINNLLTMDKKYATDYKVALIETQGFGVVRPREFPSGFVRINKRPKKRTILNLNFWCLNPTVAFHQLDDARTIILTSGTLSPMTSFASELGVNFPVTLEASHVIPSKQVWVGAIGRGPTGLDLQATYQNVNGFQFQDELGALVSQVCEVTPRGVLCFFTSYRLMTKMADRWRNTGVWARINDGGKQIFAENHGASSADFDQQLAEFYQATASGGALLLAVCRGKISEGLDFSDGNARAVITVGIPFPNFKDRQVTLKKQYNDCNTQHGLLSGSQWYDIQAYRALNQALGRCIRHRRDWGALIMVDKRFTSNPKKYCQGLSRWIREKVRIHHDFKAAVDSLSEFCQQLSTDLDVTQDQALLCEKTPNKTTTKKAQAKQQRTYAMFNKSYYAKSTPVKKEAEKKILEEKVEPFFPSNTLFPKESEETANNVKENEEVTSSYFKTCCKSEKLPSTTAEAASSCSLEQSSKITPLEVTIVPESPECKRIAISDDDDDFATPSSSKKRKQVRDRQSVKKCQLTKKELNFEEDIQPKTRKKARKQVASYRVCCRQLTHGSSKLAPLANTKISFTLVEKTFPKQSAAGYKTCDTEDFFLVTSPSDREIGMNCVWCDEDKLAYQFYACSTCSANVGFQVKNLPNFDQNKLIVFSSLCKRT